MAMIKCKECGAEVSDKAKTCPSCGAPTPKKTSIFTWIVGAFLIAFFYGMISSEITPEPQKTPEEIAEEKKWDDRLALAVAGAKDIKKAMRDPSSLQFDSVLTTVNGDVCYEYRAKNGFGGMNKEYSVLTADGKFHQDSDSVWKKKCAGIEGHEVKGAVQNAPL